MRLIALKEFRDSVGTKSPGQAFDASDSFGQRLIAQGYAVKESVAAELPWTGISWPWEGTTAIILASGPSLTVGDCKRVGYLRDHLIIKYRVIAINTTFRMAPWADVLYGCDVRWWKIYLAEIERTSRSARWSQDEDAKKLGVNWIKSETGRGLGRKPGVINQGHNSGFQAINLAYQAGAKRIILLGYDMQNQGTKTHHHGDHPTGLNTRANYAQWIEEFNLAARDLRAEGVEVVNATPGSALTCFPMVRLEEALT